MIYIITHKNKNNKIKIHLSTKARKIAEFLLSKMDADSGFELEVFTHGKEIPIEYKWITD